ncbi:hypothetical protein B0A48_01396 [Cryoendolithus antarcticus]|uniref:DUF7719 domain-containing protein n=1 Tax=Cryoendolithus antarcticus TaxID=1507870 RepID=A0A1V8TT72_9PEZI|nr:hypothetical protein B0A48_01396 [Cryoendolithus antarcticus]
MADDAKAPGNRRERRAAAKSSSQPIAPPTKTPNIKMAHPDRSGPKGKTLLDLYDEKKDLLSQGQPFDPKHLDGAVRDEGGNILTAGLGSPDDEPIGVFGQAVFWSYRQEIVWGPIWKRTFTVLPVLWLLVYLTRSELARRWQIARQVFFLGVAVAAGCYTIHVGNNFAYYAVMKQAPPLGTLWVWSVIEMQLPYAAASVVPVVAYLYFNGYAVF